LALYVSILKKLQAFSTNFTNSRHQRDNMKGATRWPTSTQ
jgi:hypothetical protein